MTNLKQAIVSVLTESHISSPEEIEENIIDEFSLDEASMTDSDKVEKIKAAHQALSAINTKGMPADAKDFHGMVTRRYKHALTQHKSGNFTADQAWHHVTKGFAEEKPVHNNTEKHTVGQKAWVRHTVDSHKSHPVTVEKIVNDTVTVKHASGARTKHHKSAVYSSPDKVPH
jgi:hypothetical protein